MIALLSVPNTGTWFTLELLKSNPKVELVIDYSRGFWGIGRKEYTREILKYEEMPDLSSVVYRRHILGNKTHGEIDLICLGHKAVIPFRDPLASLISRKNRNPLQAHYEHIDAFDYVATSPHIWNSFIFPIDNDGFKSSAEFRMKSGENLIRYCGLPWIDLLGWATDNEPKNAMPSYEPKAAYASGDLGGAVRDCYGEYLYLKSKEETIRPFMEKIGYRNVIWWD